MNWFLEHAPSLLTLSGGLVAAYGALWSELRRITETEKTKSLKPAVIIFVGAVVAATGIYWSDLRNAALDAKLISKSDALLQKSEELASKNAELARKSDELAKKNGDLARKSDELAALSANIASTVSGGKSYCAVLPILMKPYTKAVLVLQSRGLYPLYDVAVLIKDVTKAIVVDQELRQSASYVPAEELEKELNDEERLIERAESLSSTFKYRKSIGNLVPGDSRELVTLELPPGNEERYEIEISARNGFFTENLVLRRLTNEWVFADRVYRGWNYLRNRKHFPKPLEEFAQPKFPRENNGTPEW